jgi:hypothetical protein
VFTDERKTKVLGESEAIFNKNYKSYAKYVATRITCNIYSNSEYVKLVHKYERNVESKYIRIKYSEKVSSDNEIVVCVRPLYGPYDSIRSLLEFIAYYRINGISKFVIYNDSVSQRVSQLLKSMSEFVEIIPWHSSDGLMNEHEDQFSSIDDCLHRYENKILLFIDIDEYIIPFSHKTLKDLLMNERKNPSIAALSIQNVFFCCEFNVNSYKSFPRISNHFNRQWNVWPKGLRSKVIALRTEFIDKIGVHSLSVNNYNSIVKHMDESNALMFHYRSCCGVRRTPAFKGLISFRTVNDFAITDQRMNKFSADIIQFIEQYIYL